MNHQTIIWGSFCLLALGAALKWPAPTRRFLGVFFIVMGLGVNLVYVLLDPAGFVRIGTDAPLVGVYAWAFSTLVALWPIAFGVLLASYEVALGTFMIIGGRPGRWGLLAGIGFLVASTPLSTWTLPNLILAAALAIILFRAPRPDPADASHPQSRFARPRSTRPNLATPRAQAGRMA